MVKIRKYTLKKEHENRLTGGSDNNPNLNRRERRKLSRTLPKLQSAIRSRISNNSIAPKTDSTVLSPPPILIPPSYPKRRIRRGRRPRSQTRESPILWYPVSPSGYSHIPVLPPIPVSIPNKAQSTFDSKGNEIIALKNKDGKEYALSIDPEGLVTVLKDDEDSQDQTGGRNVNGDLRDALENNDLEQMRIAIESGANLNIQWNHELTIVTPLIYLAKSEEEPNIEMVDLLLTNNVNPNIQNPNGETALHWAATKGHLEMVEKLLESENIDIHITARDGEGPLHRVSRGASQLDDEDRELDRRYERIMVLLIQKGINIDKTTRNGMTALHNATARNNLIGIGILLRAGANQNIKTYRWNDEGQTAYDLARFEFYPEALTAFHAFERERAQAAINSARLGKEAKNENSLLNSLPDEIEEEIRSMFGGTPNQDLITISMGPINTGDIHENIENLQKTLDNGANINTRDDTGRTALSYAGADTFYHNTGHNEIIEFLLENGADANIPDINGNTPLIWSITYSNLEFARILLENNANPNVPDNQLDETPLHIAVQIPFIDSVELLLKNGANPNQVNIAGDTPLHLACTFALFSHTIDPRMFEILFRYGANENIPNDAGETASDLIQNHTNPQLRNILVETRRQMDFEQFTLDSLSRRRNISDNVMGARDKKYLRKTGGKKQMKLIGGTPDDDLLNTTEDRNLEQLRQAIESGANVDRKLDPRTRGRAYNKTLKGIVQDFKASNSL